MINVKRAVAALAVGTLAAFVPAAAATATGANPPPPPGRPSLSGADKCAEGGWTATFTLRNGTARQLNITKVEGDVEALAPVSVAPGGTATGSVLRPADARYAEVTVYYQLQNLKGIPAPVAPDSKTGGDHGNPPVIGKLHQKIHRTCKCPTTPPSGEPSNPPTGEPSNPPSNPPSSNPPSSPPPAEETDEPLPPADNTGNQLPLTGSPAANAAVIGGGLLLLGAGAVAIARRRRRFEA